MSELDEWMKHGTCRVNGIDTNEFFLERGMRKSRDDPRRHCTHCPVKYKCLEYALAIPGKRDAGVYGGTTPLERRVIRRQRAKGARV